MPLPEAKWDLQGLRSWLHPCRREAPAQSAHPRWREPQAVPVCRHRSCLPRFVHLAVKDDETERSAVAFLKEAVRAFPFQVTHVLTDRGSCFTADGFARACEALGVAHRKTRPYTPKPNGMEERFNARIQREVLGITVASHRDLETLLHGFNRAYDARRQRVLKGRSPERVVHER